MPGYIAIWLEGFGFRGLEEKKWTDGLSGNTTTVIRGLQICCSNDGRGIILFSLQKVLVKCMCLFVWQCNAVCSTVALLYPSHQYI